MSDDRKNVKRCKETLQHDFTEFEKSKLGGVLAALCRKLGHAELAKKTAMAAHASEIKRIQEEIAERTNAIECGYEQRMIDCEWHMHDPREGWKTLYRLDTGSVVTSEEMDWSEKQGAFIDRSEDRWPQPDEHGDYPYDRAEVIGGELPGGEIARIRVLQVGSMRWASGYEWAFGGSEPSLCNLQSSSVMYTREAAVAAAAKEAIEAIRAKLAIAKSTKVKDQLGAVGAAFAKWREENVRWPARSEDGTWPPLGAEVRSRELTESNWVQLHALEVQPDVWLYGWSFNLLGESREFRIGKGDENLTIAELEEHSEHAYDSSIEAHVMAAGSLLGLLEKELAEDKRRQSPLVVDVFRWLGLVADGHTDEEIAEGLKAEAEAEAEASVSWPQPNEHGVYPEDGAEKIEASKLPKGASASVRILQIAERDWVAAWSVGCGVGCVENPLWRDGDDASWASRAHCLADAFRELVEWVEDRLREDQPKTGRAQLLAIGKWAKNLKSSIETEIELAARSAVEQQIAKQMNNSERPADGNGLTSEFEQLDQPDAQLAAEQAVAQAQQYRDGKSAGAGTGADWE